jgi:diadenosine tetraphosphate (Ap4A) HIT family hydrolase
MENINTNIYSHLTAKERDSISFPARHLLKNNLLKGKVLDFGCGLGSDVNILKEIGVDVVGYDKFYFPQLPNEKFDTIICLYVLNVLLKEEQTEVLLKVSQLLNPGGIAYFAVRRDVKFEGFRTHKIHQKQTYQCNVVLPYKSILLNEYCEIYEYKHINQSELNLSSDCPFCNPDKDREIILESASVFAIYDKFPVSNGHVLIIPKKHVSNYFELSFKEQSACWFVLNAVQKIIQEKFNPDGFNVGININETAGQTVPHVHIHLIPRYNGDVEIPRGGVRGVIPDKKEY